MNHRHRSVRRSKFRVAVTSVVMMVASVLLPLATAGPATAAVPVKVISANVSGDENNGSYASLSALNSMVAAQSPDIVFAQEICYGQALDFMNDPAHAGWTMHWTSTTINKPTCATASSGLTELGLMMATPHGATYWGGTNLGQNTSNTTFKMACSTVYKPGIANGVLACTTKLIASPATDAQRASQTSIIKSSLHNDVVNRQLATVLAGDFNTTPTASAMDNIYRLKTTGGWATNAGKFYEADQTDASNPSQKPASVTCSNGNCRWGDYTHQNSSGQYEKKFDYIFLGYPRAPTSSLHLTVTNNPHSRHRILYSDSHLQQY